MHTKSIRATMRPRRRKAVPQSSQDDLVSETEMAAETTSDVSTPGPVRRPDPGERLAGLVLVAALQASNLQPEAISAPGVISFVQVSAADWVEPVRRAWIERVLGKDPGEGRWLFNCGWTYDETAVFSAEGAPEEDAPDAAKTFVDYVARWWAIVGVSADPRWLPADLIAAADHHVVLAEPTPQIIATLARDLTSEDGTTAFSAEQAAAVTPRLARLSTRPQQRADDFLRKLRTLIAVERAKGSPAGGPPAGVTVREAPDLDQLAGMDEAVAWGRHLRVDLVAYAAGQRRWADVDRGLLLSGPPGTGKTTFPRALSSYCGVPMVTGSYSSWIGTADGYQGDLIRAMRASFADARAKAPCILFIDEIDAFPARSRAGRVNRDWDNQVVAALLAEIDGVEDRAGVVVVAACNHPDRLDAALVRSGRLDRHVKLKLPTDKDLVQILRMHLAGALPDEDLRPAAMRALGYTGADIERVVRGAHRRARQEDRALTLADLIAEMTDRHELPPAEMRILAVHEAGHAIAGIALGIRVDGIALRRAGRSRGFTQFRVRRAFLTTEEIHNQLILFLAGRAAEMVVLGRASSSAGGDLGSDLQQATHLAARAAAEWGLEEGHGLTWRPLPEDGSALSAHLALDAKLAALVRRRLDAAYSAALKLMKQHRIALDALAERLLAEGAMDGDQVAQLIKPYL